MPVLLMTKTAAEYFELVAADPNYAGTGKIHLAYLWKSRFQRGGTVFGQPLSGRSRGSMIRMPLWLC